MKPPSTFDRAPDVDRAFEPGAVAHLDALLHHHGAVAHVEHHARLDRGAHDHDLRRGRPAPGCPRGSRWRAPPEIGAVLGQEALERGDQVEGAAEQQAVDLERLAPLVRPLPPLACRHDPADRPVAVVQPAHRARARGPGIAIAGRREPGGRRPPPGPRSAPAAAPAARRPRGTARRAGRGSPSRPPGRPPPTAPAPATTPARSSATGRTPANGAHAAPGSSGSSR